MVLFPPAALAALIVLVLRKMSLYNLLQGELNYALQPYVSISSSSLGGNKGQSHISPLHSASWHDSQPLGLSSQGTLNFLPLTIS
jgi:hypothetical protein